MQKFFITFFLLIHFTAKSKDFTSFIEKHNINNEKTIVLFGFNSGDCFSCAGDLNKVYNQLDKPYYDHEVYFLTNYVSEEEKPFFIKHKLGFSVPEENLISDNLFLEQVRGETTESAFVCILKEGKIENFQKTGLYNHEKFSTNIDLKNNIVITSQPVENPISFLSSTFIIQQKTYLDVLYALNYKYQVISTYKNGLFEKNIFLDSLNFPYKQLFEMSLPDEEAKENIELLNSGFFQKKNIRLMETYRFNMNSDTLVILSRLSFVTHTLHNKDTVKSLYHYNIFSYIDKYGKYLYSIPISEHEINDSHRIEFMEGFYLNKDTAMFSFTNFTEKKKNKNVALYILKGNKFLFNKKLFNKDVSGDRLNIINYVKGELVYYFETQPYIYFLDTKTNNVKRQSIGNFKKKNFFLSLIKQTKNGNLCTRVKSGDNFYMTYTDISINKTISHDITKLPISEDKIEGGQKQYFILNDKLYTVSILE